MRARVPSVRPRGGSGVNSSRAAREPHSRDTRAQHGGSEHSAARRGRRQLEEEVVLDPGEDSGDRGSTCRGRSRSKATSERSRRSSSGLVTALSPHLRKRPREWRGSGQQGGSGHDMWRCGECWARGVGTRVQAQRKCEECAPSCARGRKKAPRRGSEEEPPLRCQTRSFVIQSEGDEARSVSDTLHTYEG